jgi:hypothetical protein
MDGRQRLENYAHQKFVQVTGGHVCDLITERVEGDVYMIGCPEHGYAMMRCRLTDRQLKRLRKKAS